MPQEILLKQLLLDPERQCHREAAVAPWCEGKIRLQQPLEFDERLVVEDNKIDVAEPDLRVVEAIAHGVGRKTRVVLAAAESLLLRRRDDLSVDDQHGSAVVIERGQTEDAHQKIV